MPMKDNVKLLFFSLPLYSGKMHKYKTEKKWRLGNILSYVL